MILERLYACVSHPTILLPIDLTSSALQRVTAIHVSAKENETLNNINNLSS